MKSMKRNLAILLLMALTLGACSPTVKEPPAPVPHSQEKDKKPEEKKGEAAEVDITDMNGRTVRVPSPRELKKVYYASPLGQLMIYTINPDRMAGSVMELRPDQKKYMPRSAELPVMGNFDGGKPVNPEQVIASGAQVFISMGPMVLNEDSKRRADELQEKLKMPVVVNGRFEERANAYRFLGTLFGEEERTERLAAYCEKAMEEVAQGLQSIPEEKRVRLYYAESPNGLATEPAESSHAAVFNFAGAKNVANVENSPGKGMTPVTMEQVLAWNPEVIFMGGGKSSPYKVITQESSWANIDAVKNQRVYEAPHMPFSWIDRPPSSQQILGLRYVAQLLYPETFTYDMREVTREFFQLFYGVETTEEDLDALLGEKR